MSVANKVFLLLQIFNVNLSFKYLLLRSIIAPYMCICGRITVTGRITVSVIRTMPKTGE